MKRLFAIFFCFVYLVPTLGISLNLHYCGETLTAISLFNIGDKNCCCGEEEESDDCCKDKSVNCQVKEGQNTAVKITPLQVQVIPAVNACTEIFRRRGDYALLIEFAYIREQRAVPDDPVYILNRILRI
jgi:hypothetical protein